MKNRLLSLTLILSMILSNVTPALNAQTWRQKIVAKMPSMPAWTKGPGFQAAKKWWKRESLTTQEQAAFNSLKKRVALGAIVAALTIIIGAYALKSQSTMQQQRSSIDRLLTSDEKLATKLKIILDKISDLDKEVSSKGVKKQLSYYEERLHYQNLLKDYFKMSDEEMEKALINEYGKKEGSELMKQFREEKSIYGLV